jgi:hypothetical protein
MDACKSSFEISSKTSQILLAMISNSFSFIPRAVNAGDPIRIPDVTKGLRVSPGTVFLFTVIPAFPKAASASFPEKSLFKKRDQYQMIVGSIRYNIVSTFD